MADAAVADTAPPAGTAAPTGAVEPRRLGHIEYKWIALGIVLLGTIMTILDATIVNIALNTLQRDFHAPSYNNVAWIVTGYALAQGAVIPLSGWATDRWGTKKLFIATVFLFTAASAACGLSQSLGQLIVFRVLQGIGGGMMMPIGMTVILQTVGPAQMGRVMGFFGLPMLIAPAAGPVLGGWFVQDFTWRLIFYVNVPIGIITLVAAWMLLVETPKRGGLHLDLVGAITATPAVVALMYAVDVSTTLGWGSALVISLCTAFVVFLASFVATQLNHRRLGGNLAMAAGLAALVMAVTRGSQVGWVTVDALSMLGFFGLGLVAFVMTRSREEIEPLLHLELFKDTTFKASMILSFLIVTSMFGSMLLLPLFLQQVHGYDALHTGLFLLPQAATAAIAMPLGGFLSDKVGPRPVVMFGLVLLGIGSLMLTDLSASTSASYLILALAIRGFAMGFAMMPAMAAALARIDRRFTSRASSITNTLQRIATAVGVAVLVTFLSSQFSVASTQATCNPPAAAVAQARAAGQAANATQLCAVVGGQIRDITTGKIQPPAAPPRPTPLSNFAAAFSSDTLSIAFDRTFFFVAILSTIGLIPALFLRKPERHVDVPAETMAA
jgi:MFS family permease